MCFYNGWKSGHHVNPMLVFALDGQIQICTLNCHGCWHDSNKVDYGILCDKLEEIFEVFTSKIVVDSAFNLAS